MMRHMFEVHSLVRKLAKWLVLLIEIDVEYMTKKIVEGRVVTEFLE